MGEYPKPPFTRADKNIRKEKRNPLKLSSNVSQKREKSYHKKINRIDKSTINQLF